MVEPAEDSVVSRASALQAVTCSVSGASMPQTVCRLYFHLRKDSSTQMYSAGRVMEQENSSEVVPLMHASVPKTMSKLY